MKCTYLIFVIIGIGNSCHQSQFHFSSRASRPYPLPILPSYYEVVLNEPASLLLTYSAHTYVVQQCLKYDLQLIFFPSFWRKFISQQPFVLMVLIDFEKQSAISILITLQLLRSSAQVLGKYDKCHYPNSSHLSFVVQYIVIEMETLVIFESISEVVIDLG